MKRFRITKLASSQELHGLTEALNTTTRDGHVVQITRINPSLWLLLIEVGHQEDFETIRRL